MESNERLVVIYRATLSVEAHMMKGVLENHDIESFLSDEHTVAIYPLYSTLLGGIKLHVRESEAGKAIQVLKEARCRNYTSEEGITITCPKCSSEKIEANYYSMKSITGIFSMLIAFLTLTYPLWAKHVFLCHNCGNTFGKEE